MSHAELWYAARATGTTLLLVLTLTVVLGIVARSGRRAGGLPGFAVAAVHRNTSLLAVALLVVHVVTVVLDPFSHLGALDTVLPFGAGYRPFWVGLGTCAADVLLALVVTSLLRRRIGARIWRGVHWAAYAVWPLAFAHSLGSGTDAGTGWLRAVAGGCAVTVVLAVCWRCSDSFHRRRPSGSLAAGLHLPDRPPRPPAARPHQPRRPGGAEAHTVGRWTR
ncbi:ferric reductase-like transmembrane domain-containing protein [Frankia sp. AgB1.9]|uniref:ferric reductase-like transmembrane domain-containing protein n=1 Tax=unclassified Frankia TaxID=2632575 RepID=UPI00193295A0|nr:MULTISPECIES: ferric reductase-like transmembrane domain-containing protein [unclassified Frankia]MBL7488649.1 ferric reductase-like transmembrane domain-containing protein [Frankia sp. AgW1.1]MBL7551769.1 ferric reductase-like transmembrane domain-containing protein [Frankia sp. AgB1.9]MBL7621090.1 ferric reductase-like transmembrane domain-containing protein [Frankia sp. AgB1.8]